MEEVLQNIKLNGKKSINSDKKGCEGVTERHHYRERVDVSVPAKPLETPSSLAF
jgi:hypothetical protein